MSSEGSVSSSGSKIRQFGLYRSIDARTEEFLRLSRRRQIRQGCACAAVSTAITVTVVVVVIFVYEFSLNSEVNVESSLNPNWHSLINDTTENSFETKYSKGSIDKTTLKLLPILLKALKKNVFLDNILEEQSSSSPFEEKETTEYSFEKNVFTRNWFRFPTSKFYAIAYKTSPINYYKSPKNLDYFTKIRKIREHQRVINYVDKMISEKVTRPMLNEEINSEKPPPKNLSSYKTNIDKNKYVLIKEKKSSCKCPMNFGKILKKILSGVEQLLSVNTNTKENKTESCIIKTSSDKRPTNLTIINKTRHDYNLFQKKIGHERVKTQNIQNHLKNNTQHYNNLSIFENSTLMLSDHADATDASQSKITKPMIKNNKYKNILNQRSTSLNDIFKNFYQRLDGEEQSTQPTNTGYYEKYFATTISINNVFNSYGLKSENNEVLNQIKKLRQELLNTKIIQDKEPLLHRKPEIITEKTVFAPNSVWLDIRDDIYRLIEKENHIQIKPKPTKTTTRIRKKSSHITTLSPTTTTTGIKNYISESDLAVPSHIKNIVTKLTKNKTKKNSKNIFALFEGGSKNVTKVATLLVKNDTTPPTTTTTTTTTMKILLETNETKNKSDSNMFNTLKTKLINMTDDTTKLTKKQIQLNKEEEIENLSNVTVEDLLKLPDSSMDPLMASNASIAYKTDAIWEELKNENVPAWKSMIPYQKPIYLEIPKKNEWMHEQDYDFNIINNYEIEI